MSLCSIRALVALLPVGQYALLARLCAHWRCAHTPRVAPPPTHWGGGIKSLRYSRIGAIGRRYGALRIDGLAVS